MSTGEVLTRVVEASPPAQFLRLILARERGDKSAAQDARRLEKLGVKVRFARGNSRP
jgi:hypothetical protein